MEVIKKYLLFEFSLSKSGVILFAAFLFLGIFSPIHFIDAGLLDIPGKIIDVVGGGVFVAMLFMMTPIGWIVLAVYFVGAVVPMALVATGALLLNFVISDKFIFLPYTSGGIVDIGWNITRDIANLLFVAILIVIALRTMLGSQQGGIRLLPKLIGIVLIVNFTKVIASIVVDFANIITNYFLEPIANVGWMIFKLFILGSPLSNIIFGGIKVVESISLNPLTWVKILDYVQAHAGISAIIGNFIQLGGLVIMSILLFLTLLVFSLIFMIRYVAIWLLVIVSPLAFAAMILPDTAGFARKWWQSFVKWSFMGVGPAFILFLMAKIIEIRSATPTLFGKFSPSQGIVSTEGGLIQQILSPIYIVISEMTFWFVIIVLMVMGLLAALQLQDKSARFIIKNSRKVIKGAGSWVAQKTAERYGEKAQQVGTKISTSGPARIPIFGGLVRTAGDKVAAFRAYGEKEWEKEKKQALSMSTKHNFSTAMISDDPDEFKGKIMAELEKDPEEVWDWLNRDDATGTSEEKKKKFGKMINYMSKTGRHREFLWYFPEFAGTTGIEPAKNPDGSYQNPYDAKVMGIADPTHRDYAESQRIQAEYNARFAHIADPAERATAIKNAKLTRIYAKHIKKEREKFIVAIANQDVLQGIDDNEFIITGDTINSQTKLKSYEDALKQKYKLEILARTGRPPTSPLTPAEDREVKGRVAQAYVKILRPQNIKNIPEGKLHEDPYFLNALSDSERKLDFKSLESIKEIQGDEDFELLLEHVARNQPREFVKLGDSERIFHELMSRDMQQRYKDLGGKKWGTSGGSTRRGRPGRGGPAAGGGAAGAGPTTGGGAPRTPPGAPTGGPRPGSAAGGAGARRRIIYTPGGGGTPPPSTPPSPSSAGGGAPPTPPPSGPSAPSGGPTPPPVGDAPPATPPPTPSSGTGGAAATPSGAAPSQSAAPQTQTQTPQPSPAQQVPEGSQSGQTLSPGEEASRRRVSDDIRQSKERTTIDDERRLRREGAEKSVREINLKFAELNSQSNTLVRRRMELMMQPSGASRNVELREIDHRIDNISEQIQRLITQEKANQQILDNT